MKKKFWTSQWSDRSKVVYFDAKILPNERLTTFISRFNNLKSDAGITFVEPRRFLEAISEHPIGISLRQFCSVRPGERPKTLKDVQSHATEIYRDKLEEPKAPNPVFQISTPPPSSHQRQRSDERFCSFCGRQGHHYEVCRRRLGTLDEQRGTKRKSVAVPPSTNPPSPKKAKTQPKCFTCGKLGHFGKECPMAEKFQEWLNKQDSNYSVPSVCNLVTSLV